MALDAGAARGKSPRQVREIEDVLDQGSQPPSFLHEEQRVLASLRRLFRTSLGQRLGQQPQGREGRPQFVGDRRHEIRLLLVQGQLAQERLSLAISAQAAAQRAFDEAVAFTKDRKAFGKTVFDFQNTRFTLADLKARLQVGWAHIDWALLRHIDGKLTAEEASAAKLWHTETQWMIVDAALQLHGGAGYMNEYTIARLWRDARVQRIYGGTSEIMKEIVGRSL